MDITSYELMKNEIKASIVLSAEVFEKYISKFESNGDFTDTTRAKRAHYQITSELISVIQRAESISATVSDMTLEADDKNDTELVLKLETLLDTYITLRSILEEYLSQADTIIINSKNAFPAFALKQSANSTLRKIKILSNDKI